MTDQQVDLGEFEGLMIIGTTMALKGAGDGLSKAMKLDPVILHKGDEVLMVVRAVVVDVSHPSVKADDPTGPCYRKHTLNAISATLSDAAAVRKVMERHDKRIDASQRLSDQSSIDDALADD